MITSVVRTAIASGLAAFGLSALPAAPAHAVEYDLYVSEGGSNAGNCPAASPCATVTYALSLAGWGATVHVSGRIHDHITATLPGTIITGEGAASPAILDGSDTATVLWNKSGTELRSLRIEHGRGSHGAAEGGGIYNEGHLKLIDVTVADNTATNGGGGIKNWYGDVTLIRSTVTGNSSDQWLGGGIFTGGDDAGLHWVTLIDSTVSDNHADGSPGGPGGSGGGIFGDGPSPVRIIRSTISANTAASGGAVEAKFLTLIDSTVTSNSDEAISSYGTGGTALIVGSTISGNSGGAAIVADKSTVTLGADIVAGNTAVSGKNCQKTTGAVFVSAGYNLTNDVDATKCSMDAPTDRLGLDPGLGALQDNGGPTLTMMPSGWGAAQVIPEGTNPAGVAGCFGQDQRGNARPQSGAVACTSGAVEPGTTLAVAPVITSGLSATVNAGAPVDVAVTATGVPTPTLDASGLPAGLSFTDNGDGTGSLTGSTTAVGNHPITLVANNWVDPGDVQTFTLTVKPVFNPSYVAVSDANVVEGNSGARNVTFTLTRWGNTGGASSVKVATANGSATAGSDYTAVSSTTVSFGAGETSKLVTVSITGDTAVEANETLKLNLSNPVGATISDTSGSATIVNDDTSYLTVNDMSVAEPDTGTKNLKLTLTRAGSTSGTASVTVTTANGTAGSGDYLALPATVVSFAPGEKYKDVVVAVKGDTADEANEMFQLKLSAPVGASIADNAGTGTIIDDEGPSELAPTTFLAVDSVAVIERNTSTANAVLTVKRSGDVSGVTWVDVATADDTATGSDYSSVAGTVMFNPGEKTKTVGISINGDAQLETNEAIILNLSGPIGGVLSDASGTATIINDDATYVGVQDTSVVEGNAGTKTVTITLKRTGSLGGTSQVTVTTANGTATAGSDYTTKSKWVTFAAGAGTGTVSVTISGDTSVEANETFLLNLTAPIGATITDTSATTTIVNDD